MTTSTSFFVFIPLLTIILLAVNLFLAPHNPYLEKDSPFECGYHSFLSQNRTQFSVSFFIFGLLFLLFDLEILLVYPFVVSSYTISVYGLVIVLIFFAALAFGFLFELGRDALKIDSRQTADTLKSRIKSAVAVQSRLIKLNRFNPSSPPKPHAFVTLGLESKIKGFSGFTPANVILLTSIVFLFLFISSFFTEVFYPLKITFLEVIVAKFYIYINIFCGVLAGILRFSVSIQDIYDTFLPQKLLIDIQEGPFLMEAGDRDSTLKTGFNKPYPNVSVEQEQKILDDIFLDLLKEKYNAFSLEMSKIKMSLKDRVALFDGTKLTMNDNTVTSILIRMLQDQTQFYNGSLLLRLEWVDATLGNLSPEVQAEVQEIKQNIQALQVINRENIAIVRGIDTEYKQVKQYFDLFNSYRNKVKTEINRLETLSHDALKKKLPDLFKSKVMKELYNKDVPQAIKGVVDQDGYLKTKISEIINAKKN